MDFEIEIKKILQKQTGLKEIKLEIPPDPKMGDFAFPCFVLSKTLKKNPNEIAKDIASKIKLNKAISKVDFAGPYVNFYVQNNILIEKTLKEILKEKNKYGSLKLKNKKALVEHTSINPNASPHVGRARNALIGDSITRILKFHNYKTDVHYFVNDVGKQIAMLVLAAGNKKPKFDDLLKLYVKSYDRLKANPNLENDVFALLYKLEKGSKDIRLRFKQIVDICIKGQVTIFNELGIFYDVFDYESKFLWNKDTKEVLKKLEKTKKVFKDEHGRYVLDLKDYNLAMKVPVFVLTRGDKTSLYGLRDIAYNIEKQKKAKDENIIILGEEQKLYFQQIKASMDLLGLKAPRAVHYSFVLLASGAMSTRQGKVILLEEFMKEALKKAKEEIEKRKKNKATLQLCKQIGYGAIKYSILKISPEKNVIFNWEQSLSFEGETGPYIQYSHARICSILKHVKNSTEKIDFDLLTKEEEIELVKKLAEFPIIAKRAAKELRVHFIASYSYELARRFNDFYEACPVLRAEKDVQKARLVLINCVKQVLETSLSLLGIDAPDRM